MIAVKEVTKSYGPIEALRGISFSVAPGEIVGL
ncbi:MAG: sugar ABC transporter ATP-binding protein, partial [Chloroflexi bacterium]|nr:sugar ABC transporter ATP-binding protein [Chloroflexota bacterium]